ncbi:MAG: YcaO-like family protein [Elusimicrobiota bacterium]|nr:YcaO-like family protein [Elusimicrobiota bacterium]
MKSAGSSRWSIDLSFIRKGSARIRSPLTGGAEDLRWSIFTVPSKLLPISIVGCRLTGMGREAEGIGDSLMYTDSLTQAFAEAWERLWLDLLRDRPIGSTGLPRSSNGFACGATPGEAEASARAELIERAVYLTAWNSRKGWEKVPTAGLLNRAHLASLEYLGWGIDLFRLSEVRLGDVICGLGRGAADGVLFDCCYQRPGVPLKDVQSKVLRSLLRSAVVRDGKPSSYAPLPASGGPESHRSFYMNPENRAAFKFLESRHGTAEPIEVGGYDDVETSVLVDIEGFPCVAAATNPHWPRLSWGSESLQEGGNPWPHPLV